MKELKSKSLLIYDPETGEKKEIDIFRGESAYEAAVRLGMTTLSEEQWVREYDANRDAAIAAIEAKAAEALASIPEDYTELDGRVKGLQNNLILTPDNFDFGFELKTVATYDGVPYYSETRICSKLIAVSSGTVVKCSAGFIGISVVTYDMDINYIASTGWVSNEQVIPQDSHIRIIMRKDASNSMLTEEDITNISSTLSVHLSNYPIAKYSYTKAQIHDRDDVVFLSNVDARLWTFEDVPGYRNGVYVKTHGDMLLRGSYNYSFKMDEQFSNLLTTSPNGVENCVHIPHNGSMIFNTEFRRLEIVDTLEVGDNIAIFKVGVHSDDSAVIGGIGMHVYQEWLLSRYTGGLDTIFAAGCAAKKAHFEADGKNGIYFKIPATMFIRGAWHYDFEFYSTFADVLTTSPQGVESCVHIPHNGSLIFNVITRKLEIANTLSVDKNVMIFGVGYADSENDKIDGVLAGIGQWYYMQWAETQRTGADTLPAYWQTEIDTTVVSAQDKMMNVGINGETFLFITDQHWNNNVKRSPYITAELAKRLGIKNIVLGGDYIAGGEKTANALLMSDCLEGYRAINANLFPLFGNHDSNTYNNEDSEHFTKDAIYALMHNHLQNVDYGEYFYFLFDNELRKTRYICLDTGEKHTALSAAQRAWFESVLSSTPSGYKIFVFAHQVYDTNQWQIPLNLTRTAFMNTVCDLCDSFNSNNTDKEIVCIFGGHAHIDLDYSTTGGIPIILFDSDSKQTYSGIDPTEGTINEQCVSVVTVDYTDRKIYVTRAGRGSDMEFDY